MLASILFCKMLFFMTNIRETVLTIVIKNEDKSFFNSTFTCIIFVHNSLVSSALSLS